VRRRWLLAAALATSATGCDDGVVGGDDMAGTTGESTGDESGDESGGTVDEGPWSSFDERPCPPDSFLSYENFGGPFLLTYCTGCHHSGVPADLRQGAPLDVNFDTLEDVRGRAATIWLRAADQNATMPPVGPAGEAERALLGEWLACGAPTDP
jgi:hypothetical protein